LLTASIPPVLRVPSPRTTRVRGADPVAPAAGERTGGAICPDHSYDPAFTANGSGASLLLALLIGDDEQDLQRLTAVPLPADVGCSA
jgi:hypothetical protein